MWPRDDSLDKETLEKSKVSPNDYRFMTLGIPYYGLRFMTDAGYQIMTAIGFSQPAQWYNGAGGIPGIRRGAIERLEAAMEAQGLDLLAEWKDILEKADNQDSLNSQIISRGPRYSNSITPINHLDNTWNACGYAIVDAELRSLGMQGLIADTSFFIIEKNDINHRFPR